MNSLSSIHRNIFANANVSPIYNYNINNSNLINYYPFDTDLNDYKTGSAVSNVTAIRGAAIVTTNTKLTNGSLYLNNASTQAIQIPSMSIAAGGFTFACWVKFMTGSYGARLFDFFNANNLVAIYQSGSSAPLQIGLYSRNPSSGSNGIRNTGYSLPDTNWHHFCVTISSAGVWTIYINGTGNTTTFTSYPSSATLTTCYIGDSDSIGDPYPTMYLNQVLVFNRTLSAGEVYTIANNPNNLTFTSAPTTVLYLDTTLMFCAFSVRRIVSTYTGPVLTLRRSSDNATSDFYTDATQSYLTTGANNTGTTFATWIGANTAFVTRWYDQSGKENHATQTTVSRQPPISLQTKSSVSKYVIKFDNTNDYSFVTMTTAQKVLTVFCQFINSHNDNATILSGQSGTDFGVRTTRIPGGNENDWYFSASGTKYLYNNGSSATSLPLNTWNSMAATITTYVSNTTLVNIGTSIVAPVWGMRGFMSEMICHNTSMSTNELATFYSNRLF
jgi:hypothetical protein